MKSLRQSGAGFFYPCARQLGQILFRADENFWKNRANGRFTSAMHKYGIIEFDFDSGSSFFGQNSC
jgi:hypothetical protein